MNKQINNSVSLLTQNFSEILGMKIILIYKSSRDMLTFREMLYFVTYSSIILRVDARAIQQHTPLINERRILVIIISDVNCQCRSRRKPL